MDPGCSLLCSPMSAMGSPALLRGASVSGAGSEEQLLFLALCCWTESLGTQYAGKKSTWGGGMVPAESTAARCCGAAKAGRISWCAAVCSTGELRGQLNV